MCAWCLASLNTDGHLTTRFTFSGKFLRVEEEKTLPNTATVFLIAEIEPKSCGSFAVGFG